MGGSRYERELVNTLDACGYVAMRAPSSGSATERELPDVLALRDDEAARWFAGRPVSEVLAIELKTTSRTTAYAEASEVEALREFAETAGARPLLAGRFKRNGHDRVHYLVPPEDCRMTDGGNYGVPESDAEDRAALVVNASEAEVVEK